MRIRRTIFVSMLMVLLACTPAFASISFEVNGSQFKPNTDYVLNNGVTYVEASTIDTLMGADVEVSDQNIVIIHNDDKLALTVGENEGLFNGEKVDLNASPYQNNGAVMLPLRAVSEILGAKITWDEVNNKVVINYQETRNNMPADEILVKASQVMNELPTYAMEGTMQIKMNMSGIEEEGFPLDLAVDTDLFAHYQKEPLAVYTKQTMNMSGLPEMPAEAANMEMEALLVDNNYYMNMPEMGWVKMDLGPLNLDDLMQTYNNQDPSLMLKQMNDFGMIATYGNDVTIDGQKYWVINVAMDQEKFMGEYQKILGQLPVPQDEFTDILSNMNFDMKYSNLVNTTTYMTDYMDMDMTMTMSMPSPEENSTEVLDMNMNMKGRFKIKEASSDFKLPDVSSAVDFPVLTEGASSTPESLAPAN